MALNLKDVDAGKTVPKKKKVVVPEPEIEPEMAEENAAEANKFSDQDDEFGDVAQFEEKSDVSRFTERLFDNTDIRGKTKLNKAQAALLAALDVVSVRYPFLEVEDFSEPLMHLLTSVDGWARNGAIEGVKGAVRLTSDQDGPMGRNGGAY